MEKKMWEIQFLSLPHILKHCKKCGKKMAFTCSEQFRINAQRKYLDIWLSPYRNIQSITSFLAQHDMFLAVV